MKYFIVFACLVVVASALNKEVAEAWKAALLEKLQKCAEKAGASADDMEVMKNHNVPATHEGKCAVFCMHQNFKIQKDDGSIDLDGGLAMMEMLREQDAELHGKLSAIMKTCSSEVTAVADPCETAALWGTCMLKEGKAAAIDASLVE